MRLRLKPVLWTLVAILAAGIARYAAIRLDRAELDALIQGREDIYVKGDQASLDLAVDDRDKVVDGPGTDRSQDRRQDRRRDGDTWRV